MSSSSHQWKSVFVNFRGKDIRDTFLSHLHVGLDKAEISYFKDNNEDDAGKEIGGKLLEAIHHAKIALVVFSANYANSTWCLNELVEILKCKREGKDPKLVVIPIFHIRAAEVSKWAIHGEFEKALESVDMEKRDDKKAEWRNALKEAKGISGYGLNTDASGNEAKLVKKIVEHLIKKIHSLDPAKNEIPHSVKVFGPFGGEGEKSWEFGEIKGIVVHCADFINSITFEVDDATSSKPQTIYDAYGRENTFKVKLDNGEYITSFAGYSNAYGNRINSLAFRTNKRILGPIGREEGKHFYLPLEAGKVIGFFGRSGDFLASIGARVEPYYPFQSVGLFGWEGGSKWDDQCTHTNVRNIIVELDSSGDGFVRSITFQYEDKNNKLSESKTHGGNDGNTLSKARNRTEMIKICPDEYLSSISGYTYQPDKKPIGGIRSLTFQTNKRTIGPIGDETRGRHFSSPATGGKIVGFYGWSDEHLHGIGAYFVPISLYPIKSIGPFGGLGGNVWDDGEKFDGVRKVEVMYNDHIHYINIEYAVDSRQSRILKHSDGTKGTYHKKGKVTLDYPQEYLTSISGYMRENGAVIQSLTFYSNRRRHGPFGKEMKKGKYFWYPSTGSKIIGFHGRCGETLNAIGVYAQPIKELYPFKTTEPFEGFGGTPWDDGVHTDVRGFRISFGDVIHSIRIEYDNNGSFVLGSEHGERGNYKYEEVMLDYPKERLLSISGWMDKNGNPGPTIIHNLKIYTTKTHYGPFIPKSWSKQDKLFGEDPWKKLENALGKLTEFHIPSEADGGRIVGFFGRAGSQLNSIGARLEPY